MSTSIVLERLPEALGNIPGAALPRRKRVYIFMTRFGFIYGVNMLVMLVGAINYSNSLAYALTFFLGSLFLVSMLHTYSSLRGLVISGLPPGPVFAGQEARFPLRFDNRVGKLRPAILLQARSGSKKGIFRKTVYEGATVVDVSAESIQSFDFPMQAKKRGLLKPGRIKISSTWPLGLFEAWSYLEIEQACIVYPAPGGTQQLPPATLLDEEEALSGKGIGTEDFIGFRQYQEGDSMRAVDWKAYARERGLVSKRFSGRGTKKVLLSLASSSGNNLESSLSQLCRWVLVAEQQELRYSLDLPGSEAPAPGNGDDHCRQCLEMLASYGLENE